jgi:hypothetical protein
MLPRTLALAIKNDTAVIPQLDDGVANLNHKLESMQSDKDGNLQRR